MSYLDQPVKPDRSLALESGQIIYSLHASEQLLRAVGFDAIFTSSAEFFADRLFNPLPRARADPATGVATWAVEGVRRATHGERETSAGQARRGDGARDSCVGGA